MTVEAPAGRAHILVVDDEEQHCRLLSRILSRDYDVSTAENVHTATELSRRQHLDVALVDFRMPDGTGPQFLAALRELQPECLRFLVTAYAEGAVLQEAVNVGQIYRFVQKPIDPEFLRVDLRRALEHRGADRELQRSVRFAAIGRLAGAVGHDLRNCIMGLQLVPELMAGDAEAHALGLSTLARAQENLRGLSDELTLLARGGTPRYALRTQDLTRLVRTTVEQIGLTPLFRDRRVAVEAAADLPPVALAEHQINRMLVNLLRNAAEATARSKSVGVKLWHTPEHVVCEIWDQGKGIAPDARKRIFEPMFSTKGAAGMGLGLWSCQLTMQAHQGSLTFTSELGEGTTFVAMFPLKS